MEMVLFIGIQAAGKSQFYRERFSCTHVRINLDMLRTRHCEQLLMNACLEGQQRFVVDNTNVTTEERARYIMAAKATGFRVIGYYFSSRVADALARNATRAGEHRVPDKAVLGTSGRLELPTLAEGFDELNFVKFDGSGGFVVEGWKNEV